MPSALPLTARIPCSSLLQAFTKGYGQWSVDGVELSLAIVADRGVQGNLKFWAVGTERPGSGLEPGKERGDPGRSTPLQLRESR